MKKNITKLLKEKEEIKNVKNANLEKEGKPEENGKMPEERKEKEKHLKIEKIMRYLSLNLEYIQMRIQKKGKNQAKIMR